MEKNNQKIAHTTWWIFSIIGVIIGLINSDSSYRDSQPIAYAFMGLVNGALIGWVFGYVIDQIKNSSTVQNISKKMEEDKVGNQKLADLQYSINKKNLPKKSNIEIYVRDEKLIQNDPIRYMSGYPGENSRVLTKRYYSIFYSNEKNFPTALDFLKYRCDSFNSIAGATLELEIIEKASKDYCKSVSQLIFFISYHESHYGNSEIFNESIVRKVYNVIQEEHNKVCPAGQEETKEFNILDFLHLKDLYSNNKDDNFDDEIDNTIIDYYNSTNDIDAIDNFDDIETNRIEITKSIEKIEDAMEEILKEYIPENPMKNTPLEGIQLMSHLRLISNVFKDELILDKEKFGFNDLDVEYVISMSYKNVLLKIFQD